MYKFKTDLSTLGGISYVMLFDGDIEHVRNTQPCMGELRKYEKTHVGDCTQPKNAKPGDLHNPFPEGTPTGLYVDFKSCMNSSGDSEYKNQVLELMFSDESPWFRGFLQREFFRGSDDKIQGVFIPTADFDPTVLVNLTKHVRSLLMSTARYNEMFMLLDSGLPIREALMVATSNQYPISQGVVEPGYYSNSKSFSFRRFLDANPRDLTGGTWGERVDYNRTDMGEPFSNPLVKQGWMGTLTKKGLKKWGYGSTGVINPKKDGEKLKDIIHEIYNEEPIPEDTKYIWTTTSGRSNA